MATDPEPRAQAEAARIRPFAPRDLAAITEIYNHYVRETHVTFDVEPFAVEARRPWLEQFGAEGPHQLVVAESEGRVVGWAGSTRMRPKPAYDSSVETTVYLAPAAVGRGLGHRLYAELLARLERAGVHRAYAAIALPNPASVALHRRLRFRPVGVFREVGYKLGRYWDVEWFEREL